MRVFTKTRILYVNHTGHVSGAEKVLLEILRGLDRERYEPFVMCPLQGGLADEVVKLGVVPVPMPAIRARFAWRPDRALQSLAPIAGAVGELRTQFRALAPDIIHANSVRAGIAVTLAATGTGKSVIWHVHDTLPRHPVSSAIRSLVLLAQNTHIVAVSQSAAHSFRGWAPLGDRVRTILNGVDLSRFPIKQPGESDFRESIGVAKEDFLVCAVGQICARKGLLELIDAFRQIQKRAPQMQLAIVGKVVFQHEEEYLAALHAAAEASGARERIHFTGELSHVSRVLQSSDLLVLNSRDEPFGLVLVEAMSSGTPVLATRVGGIPEIVTDSVNGWLVEKGDTAALAQKLLELSRDQLALARVAATAYRTTCPRFSAGRFLGELNSFYAEFEHQIDRKWNGRNRPALARSANN